MIKNILVIGLKNQINQTKMVYFLLQEIQDLNKLICKNNNILINKVNSFKISSLFLHNYKI
jgi:hypothetical protein